MTSSGAELLEELRTKGVRITQPRRMVAEALTAAGGHTTAEELHEQLAPTVDLSTIYRTLELLADHGLVRHVHLGHGPAQWHLADDEHHHLLCTDCGRTVEVSRDVTAALESAVLASAGFTLDLGHFALTGRCRDCST